MLVLFLTLARMRPPHYKLVNFTSRNSCLCIKHSNFALKLKILERKGKA